MFEVATDATSIFNTCDIVTLSMKQRKVGERLNYLELDYNKCIAAIFGLVVGDALGVPVEFKSRTSMKANPVTDMIGFGTHNQPAGTWSDDSSMVVATLEWFSEMKDVPDYGALMDKFSNWLMHGEYTPYGQTFDCGISTSRAIINYRKGIKPLQCGGKAEWENGNGSLMRILPVALWCSRGLATDEMTGKEFIYDLSTLTHGHLRSKMACLIYSKVIADFFYAQDQNKMKIIEKSMLACKAYFDSIDDEEITFEKENYVPLWDVEAFSKLDEDSIKSSGYVVDTLMAAIWCFLNTDNYRDCVLKAVNLGDDTDTVGAVAGGLAGIYYGIEAILEEWLNLLPKKEWIISLVEQMIERKKENLC